VTGLARLLAFVATAALIIMTPGPDTLVTIRNSLRGGKVAGVATAAGVCCGLTCWVCAAAFGMAAALAASPILYRAVQLIGGGLLIAYGAAAAVRSRQPQPASTTGLSTSARRAAGSLGFISNISNPKIAVFFTALFPRFGDRSSVIGMLVLGLVFVVMTFLWLSTCAMAGARLSRSASRAKPVAERLSAAMLIALGVATIARA
jgi:threonine/homoserine/homoserine lactone efflux protein